jgi:hypothetical protein
MIKDFVYAWDANKGKLKKYFEEHSKDEYCSYATVVKLLFELVVNPYLADRHEGWCEPGYNLDRIHEIDDGEYYGGTLMYLIPRNGTQPDCDDYVMTCAWYGLCETCDVMQGVYGEGGMADEGDVKCLRLERVSVAECEMAMCAMIEYIAQWCEINVMESSHPGMHVMMMAPMVSEIKRLKKEQSQEGMPQVAMRMEKEHGTGMPLEMEVNVERNRGKGTRLRRCWEKGGIMVAP